MSLCGPWLTLYFNIDMGVSSPLYYFTGYAGYFLLGYYLHTYGARLPKWSLPLLIIIPVCCLWLYKSQGGQHFYSLFWYLSVFVAMMSVAWFEGVRRLDIKIGGKALAELSNCCFGIYLLHILIMKSFLWKIDFIVHGLGWAGQIVMTWTLTFIISFLLTRAISYLPFAEYIIGYKHKRE